MNELKLNKCQRCEQDILNIVSQDVVLNIITSLTAREYGIFILTVIEQKDVPKIAKLFSVTRERIKQIQKRLIKKLLNSLTIRNTGFTLSDIYNYALTNTEKLPYLKKKEIFVLDENYDWVKAELVSNHVQFDTSKPILTKQEIFADHMPIDNLNLSVRSHNCLINSGIKTIGQLRKKTDKEILLIKNLGRKAFNEIKNALLELTLI